MDFKNFKQTEDGGFALKKNGMFSTVLIGGGLLALTIVLLKIYFDKPEETKFLLLAGLMLLFVLIIFWRTTKQFIIYPDKQLFKYSKGMGAGFQEFRFDELDGATQENMKNQYGVTSGNSFKLGFDKNGKYKEVLLGQNISAKKMRNIYEEIKQITKTV